VGATEASRSAKPRPLDQAILWSFAMETPRPGTLRSRRIWSIRASNSATFATGGAEEATGGAGVPPPPPQPAIRSKNAGVIRSSPWVLKIDIIGPALPLR